MPVYIINNLTIHDAAQYKSYLRSFMPIFEKYDGEVLAAQDRPVAVEGDWPFDRTILLSFPDRGSAERWATSKEYQTIAAHRRAGTTSNVVILNALKAPTT